MKKKMVEARVVRIDLLLYSKVNMSKFWWESMQIFSENAWEFRILMSWRYKLLLVAILLRLTVKLWILSNRTSCKLNLINNESLQLPCIPDTYSDKLNLSLRLFITSVPIRSAIGRRCFVLYCDFSKTLISGWTTSHCPLIRSFGCWLSVTRLPASADLNALLHRHAQCVRTRVAGNVGI